MILRLVQLSGIVSGPARQRYLAADAATSLVKLNDDVDGLLFTEMWLGADGSLLARRTKKDHVLPGYSPHNYGLAIRIDVKQILEQKKIGYEALLYLMKKRGWYCYRRDGRPNEVDSDQFIYIGDNSEPYLSKTSEDPISWSRPGELRIYERYGTEFQLSPAQIQGILAKLNFYTGNCDGNVDGLTREAIMSFQRAYDMVEDGNINLSLQRVLCFVSADRLIT